MIENIPLVETAEVSGPHLILQSEPDVCAELSMKDVTTRQEFNSTLQVKPRHKTNA